MIDWSIQPNKWWDKTDICILFVNFARKKINEAKKKKEFAQVRRKIDIMYSLVRSFAITIVLHLVDCIH